MKPILTAALLAATATLAGCAGLMAPGADEMAKVPVVRYGEAAPAGGEHVLLYPAGAPLPVVASVSGSLLSRTGEARMEVATSRDVYVYKNWLSFDGKNWMSGTQAVGGEFAITLPGEKDSKAPGTMSARFDLKP
ncbi:hypothetical protein [Azospirillum sp.]|uniref:hypothetical protein n=1 Tax=Azospirillum sp. TaxID=34012 RepID=UPI002D76187D|nr:hypothetical protein [Azospirillum sp.]HYD69569.1 hypothetical protein [Azospirillum sp.]